MFKFLSIGAATLALGAVSLSAAYAQSARSDVKMTEAQCEKLFSQALAGSSSDLAMDMANPYVKDFKAADKNGDKKLSHSEWNSACKQGNVQDSSASGASDGTNEKSSDRTPGDTAPHRTPGASVTGAGGTDAGKTPSGTSDRTPSKSQ